MPDKNQIEGKVSPEMFQAITMDEISWKLGKLIDLISSQIPEGIIERGSYTATTLVQEIRAYKDKKWHSVSVTNDGDVPIRVSVNAGSVNYLEVEPGETDNIDLKAAKIAWVTYYTATGTADFRITTKR